MKKVKMKYFLAILVLCINGCSSIVTDEPYAQDISNQCYEVRKPFSIYLREDYSSSSYIVGTKESYIRMWGTFSERKSIALTLPIGSEIKVVRIQNFSDGSNGHCWRVFATTKDLKGEEFELPTCWSLTSNVWVVPDSLWRLKQDELNLEMNTKYLGKTRGCKNS